MKLVSVTMMAVFRSRGGWTLVLPLVLFVTWPQYRRSFKEDPTACRLHLLPAVVPKQAVAAHSWIAVSFSGAQNHHGYGLEVGHLCSQLRACSRPAQTLMQVKFVLLAVCVFESRAEHRKGRQTRPEYKNTQISLPRSFITKTANTE
jgi:hypothetical protein